MREKYEEREAKYEEREAKHEQEREAAKRRHEELMAELTGARSELTDARSQLTDVQSQLTDVECQLCDKRQCLTDVREWGNLKEPDNTLVPQLTLRERELLAPKDQRIQLLEQEQQLLRQQVGEKTRLASEATIKRAVQAEQRLLRSEEVARQLEQELLAERNEHQQTRERAKRQRLQDDINYAGLQEKYSELARRSKGTTVYALPSALLAESPHARKHAMVAFHPDKQPTERSRRLAEPFFKQISAAQDARSEDARA